MKYQEFIKGIEEYEQEPQITECIYFEALKRLGDVQRNLQMLDDVFHVKGIIRTFLINWGMMARVIGRKGVDWNKLGDGLRELEPEFQTLRAKRLMVIQFDKEQDASNAIKKIYGKIDPIPLIGSPTNISKILHLLNPHFFVMWDMRIREKYQEKNPKVRETSEGYVEFLKEVKKELEEAFEDHQMRTGQSWDEIETQLTNKYNKTIAKLVDEYNWVKFSSH